MIKSTIRTRTWKAAYRLLDRVSPVDFDCGTICGAVCCGRPEDDMGIYLLPGEEKIHSRRETFFISGRFLSCAHKRLLPL